MLNTNLTAVELKKTQKANNFLLNKCHCFVCSVLNFIHVQWCNNKGTVM